MAQHRNGEARRVDAALDRRSRRRRAVEDGRQSERLSAVALWRAQHAANAVQCARPLLSAVDLFRASRD